MAEIHAPENQLNGVGVVGGGGGGGPLVVSTSETVGSKRQRRPSVRLGDIGDQPYDSHVRRPSTKPWKHHHHHHHNQNQNHNHNNHNQLLANATSKPSKTKPLTNLAVTVGGGGGGGEFNETLDEDKDGNNLDTVAIGSWRVKDSKKRGSAKRVRSNWVSKIDETAPGNNGDKEDKFSGAGGGGGGEDIEIENENDSYHHGDFDIENSEQSPIHSLENLGDGNERELLYRRSIRGSHHDGMELSGPSDNGGEDGVRIWLNSLGLGRYAPVFEIHEVDDEVLPMLTLEDLKDMGINAVGSRRKMFCAIQKLGKGFS